jgi:hypothetical protein
MREDQKTQTFEGGPISLADLDEVIDEMFEQAKEAAPDPNPAQAESAIR